MSSFYPYADMHCDSLLRVLSNGEQTIWDGEGMQSLAQQVEAKQLLQFYAIFFPPQRNSPQRKPSDPRPPRRDGFTPPPWAGSVPDEDDALYETLKTALFHQVEAHADKVALAKNAAEVKANREAGKVSAVLTIEDGRFINGSMEKLARVREDGVTAIALTWNFANCFGFPNSRDKELMQKGLTEFGKEAIGEMNRLGILVDVSHLSDGGFFDVAALAKKPFIASHSNARAITDHPRNLTDDMLKILADKGGITGINFCPDFIHPAGTDAESKVEYLAAHVHHIINVAGEDAVAIGTDFDGISGPLEIEHPGQMQRLFEKLEQDGLKAGTLEKLAWKNVLRVIEDI